MYTVHEKKKKSILEHVFCKAYKYFSQYILHRFLKRNKLLWWQYYENDYIYLSTTCSILISKDPPVISMAI